MRRRRRDENGRRQTGERVLLRVAQLPERRARVEAAQRVAHEADGLVRARHLPHLVGDSSAARVDAVQGSREGLVGARREHAHALVRFEPACEVAEIGGVPERPCTSTTRCFWGGAVLVASSAVLQIMRSFISRSRFTRFTLWAGFWCCSLVVCSTAVRDFFGFARLRCSISDQW